MFPPSSLYFSSQHPSSFSILRAGAGREQKGPHLYSGGTKAGRTPSGWPCLPSSGAGFLSSGDQ